MAQVLTSKRATIITAINEVEAARSEDVWLAAYEADDQRYKVCWFRLLVHARSQLQLVLWLLERKMQAWLSQGTR